jgi:hypothetical protein
MCSVVFNWHWDKSCIHFQRRIHTSCRPFVHCLLVPPIISRGAPCQATSVSEGRNYGWEMAGHFGLRFRLPRKSQGSLTCCKSATWDRWLYFPSEGSHAVNFFAQKIRRLWLGSSPRSWVPEASILTTRPPKPLGSIVQRIFYGVQLLMKLSSCYLEHSDSLRFNRELTEQLDGL